MDSSAAMTVFARVVEARGFSAAARALSLSKSQVSKEVSRLEAELGVRLLHRTTRQLSLTEIGAAFYEHCARIAQEIDAARATVHRLQAAPRGTLRITTPVTFAAVQLAPALRSYVARYPEVTIDVDATDRVVDLAEEGRDVALRLAAAPAQNVVARRIATLQWVLCAAPAYLRLHGTPQTPKDLQQHNCLVYPGLPGLHGGWRFRDGRRDTTLAIAGNCRVNNAAVLHQLVLAGEGLSLFPTYLVGPDLRAGRLRLLLADALAAPPMNLWAIYLPQRQVLPKVRTFIDHLLAHYGPVPPWERAPARPARRRSAA
jgi:DNA-binding transcriptional LysR family regulator